MTKPKVTLAQIRSLERELGLHRGALDGALPKQPKSRKKVKR
jgi:hypothetical protein